LDAKSRGIDLAAKAQEDELRQWKEFSQFASEVTELFYSCIINSSNV
jgi:hypothetical protein